MGVFSSDEIRYAVFQTPFTRFETWSITSQLFLKVKFIYHLQLQTGATSEYPATNNWGKFTVNAIRSPVVGEFEIDRM